MEGRARGTGVLLTVGLACALVGQFYFAFRREYVWDGVLFWGVSILAWSALMWQVVQRERGRARWKALGRFVRKRPLRVLATVAGMCMSFAAGWRAQHRPVDANFSGLLTLWLVGVASFLLAFVPSAQVPTQLWRRLKTWARGDRAESAGLLALLLLALVVRAYDLEHIPANLGGDEGTWAMEGLTMIDGGLANPFATRWFAFPSMSFLVWGLSMRVFGDSVAGVRVVSAILGSVSVLCTFVLGQELWNRRVAWLGAIVLAFSHYHLHFSRLAVNNVADSVLAPLALYFLVRGLRSLRAASFAFAGAVVGAGWYGYFGARLVGVAAAVYVAWRIVVEDRLLAQCWRHLLLFVVSALVVAAPLFLHYAANPGVLTEGFDRVSIFASGWLSREQEITGRSAGSLLLQQLWKSISAFHYTLDPTFWYRAQIPLLDWLSGILLVLGLIWCTARWTWPSNGLILIWFWSALITGWVITENPPSSQRMVILTPVLAMLVALGLDRLLYFVQRTLNTVGQLRHIFVRIALVVIAGLNLGYYFLFYTPTRAYGNPTAEIATRLARYLVGQEDDFVVYFHGPPFVYWDFGTLRFMARGVTGVDVPRPGEGPVPKPDLSRGARFVFHPARIQELESVRERYPGGTEIRVESDVSGELLYAVYEIEHWRTADSES